VQVAQRWILARLRNRQFFSLHELNAAISQLLANLNQRSFKKLPGSRASAFKALHLGLHSGENLAQLLAVVPGPSSPAARHPSGERPELGELPGAEIPLRSRSIATQRVI
jgi:hypothetical protein